ncbi:MAG: FmdB family zinc ribbon protein [Planctomycetota bacterium]|jgi:putative FmdB family regulatory protein
MPTYDYECDACNHRFELFQSISAEPERKCPKCKKLKLRRLIGTGAAVVFKGSGFYQTDYRSESYKKSAAADSKASGDSKAAGDSASGESKGSKPESSKTGSAKPAASDSSGESASKRSKKKASD